MSHLPSAPIRHIRRFSFFMRVIQFFRRIAPRNSFEEYIPLPCRGKILTRRKPRGRKAGLFSPSRVKKQSCRTYSDRTAFIRLLRIREALIAESGR